MHFGTLVERKAQQIKGTEREKKQHCGQHMLDWETCTIRQKEGNTEFHNVEIPFSFTLYHHISTCKQPTTNTPLQVCKP